MATTGRLDRGDGTELAWIRQEGRGPTIVFLPGFRSGMTGDKAAGLAAFAAERGNAMLRFDYSGHGASGGSFLDGTIGAWAADALAAIDQLTAGEIVLVGSSMGGWIALLTALARPERVRALIGIAAAPDFTQRLMWDSMAPMERLTLIRDGVLHMPSQYGDPTLITRRLIEEGRDHLVLTRPIQPTYPQAAAIKGQEGWVEVAFTVNANGKVSNVKVVNASPAGVFDQAAQKAVLAAVYQPLSKTDQTISRQAKLTLKFRLVK